MASTAYRVRRFVRSPLVWFRRRAEGPQPDGATMLLELHGYSPAVRKLMAVAAIDPDYVHRADLDASSVIVDVGAYRGDGAASFRRLYDAEVWAFEPNPNAFALLEERFAEDPRVHAIPWALGPADATLGLAPEGPGSSLQSGPRQDPAAMAVTVRQAAAAFEELGIERIDFMKINIEGAEYELLDHLAAAGVLPRVRYLLIQFHEWHEGAHRGRRRNRRALGATHDLVWDYPWIWELWCDRRHPHPPPPEITPELLAAVRAEVAAKRAGDASAG